MASYVLDTHACLFALGAPLKLGARARRALARAEARGESVWVPAATAAEIVLLRELGRTALGLSALQEAFELTCWKFLPMDLDQIDAFSTLGQIRDPFDRLIIAAARCARAKLITRDAAIADLGLVDVVWR
jgi:PIN domain nuclease of toxin-antitoxin system